MGCGRDDAVSSVIGTVLMLGITVTVFSGVSLVVLSEVGENSDSIHADLSILEGEAAVLLRHGGGESIPLSSGHLLVNVEGSEQEVPLSQFSAETADPDQLDIGDSLCISCLYPGQEVLGVVVIADQGILLAHGERGTPQGLAQPDLSVGLLSADPAAPWNGTTVTFEIRVENIGAASAVASSVRFLVDDVEVDSASVGPLAPGANATVNGTWTAATGSVVVRAVVDPTDLIAEEDEANNDAALVLDVSAGTPDPGAPFEDTNGDGLFENALDVLLTVATVADGVHDAGDRGLVIPPSVGALSATSWDIQGNGTHRILIDLTSTGGDITIDGLGDLHVLGNLTSAGALQATSDGTAYLNGTTFDAVGDLAAGSWSAGAQLVGATMTSGAAAAVGSNGAGPVDATGLALTGVGLTQLRAAGDLDAAGATVTSTTGRGYVFGGSITAHDLTITAESWAYVYATSTTADITDATLTSATDYTFAVAAQDLTASGATLSAPIIAYAGSTAGDVTANGATVTATGGTSYAYVHAPGGSVLANSLDADAETAVHIEGQTGIVVQDADLTANAGTVNMVAEADIDIQRSTLRADTLSLNLDDAANELFVQDTCFLDDAGSAASPTVNPSGVTVTGVPACGGPAVSDPGFPYEDTNGDGAYTEGTDQEIATSEFDDGIYDAGSNGLVIPASFGPLTANEIDLKANGPARIDVDVTATSSDITIDVGGPLEMDGSTFTTQTNDRDITIQHGGLSAAGSTFDSRGHLTLDGDATELTGASLTTLNNNKDIDITSTTLTAPGVDIESRGHVTVAATGAVDLDGATIETLVDNKDIDIQTTGDIGLEGATVNARGHMDLTGGDVHLEGLDLNMLVNGKHFEVAADGWIHGDASTNLETRGDITFDADAIRMESVTINMLRNNDDLEWTANDGSIDADGAQIELRGKAFFTADDDIWFRNAFINGLRNNKEFEFTGNDIHFENSSVHNRDELISNTSGTVYGSATTDFQDDDDLMDVEPNGAHNNTPSGVWT